MATRSGGWVKPEDDVATYLPTTSASQSTPEHDSCLTGRDFQLPQTTTNKLTCRATWKKNNDVLLLCDRWIDVVNEKTLIIAA